MAGAVEGEGDLAVAGFFRLHHLVVIGHRLRIRFLERGERENDVVGRDRRAVVPFCFGPQPKGNGRKIARIAQRFGQEAVSGRNFVERLRQQRVVKEIGALDESAFDQADDGIEIVEGAERDLPRRAAFRRFGVDVVETRKAGRIFQVAKRRRAVPPNRPAVCAAALVVQAGSGNRRARVRALRM